MCMGVEGWGSWWCTRTMRCGAAFIIQSGPFSALRSGIPPVTDLVDGFQLAAWGQRSLLLYPSVAVS